MARNNISYKELAKARIQDKRSVVISTCSKGGYTIAQQLEVKEGDFSTVVFLKGALHVDNIQGLANIRDAINTIIADSEAEDEMWDK